MELELRHLRTLCAIADAGSVGRAAVVLGYSQPAMSTQLRRIERLFGEPLFLRGPGGIEPTAYGAEVVAQARDVLTRAEAIGRRGSAASGAGTRTLRFAATNTPMLPGLVGRLRGVLPDLAVSVSSVYSSAAIVGMLEDDVLDAGVAADYPSLELAHSDRLAHRGIVTEPSFVALPARHPLARRVEVALADLASEAWFMTPDDGAGWPGVFYAACQTAGFEPAVVHDFLGDQTQLQTMIADGLGVSLVQATVRPQPGVVVKPLAGTPLWCRYLLVWRRAGLGGDVAEALFASASAAYRTLIARSAHFQTWAAGAYRTSRGAAPQRPAH